MLFPISSETFRLSPIWGDFFTYNECVINELKRHRNRFVFFYYTTFRSENERLNARFLTIIYNHNHNTTDLICNKGWIQILEKHLILQVLI
jgi:hypothetical protein